MSVVARRVQVYGRVQGVFYRAVLRQWCVEHGVVGWIKNKSDGSVLMHVEGDEFAIEQCLGVAKQGSIHAHVDRMTVEETAPEQRSTFAVIAE